MPPAEKLPVPILAWNRGYCVKTMQIEENKPLAPFTTFGIGGPARWYVQAASEAEILEATTWADRRSVPLFVLGGGSNLLVSDAGFPGLVLQVALKGIRTVDDPKTRIYEVAGGEDWDHFVQRTVDDRCAGIECLAGIPARLVERLCRMLALTDRRWLLPSNRCAP